MKQSTGQRKDGLLAASKGFTGLGTFLCSEDALSIQRPGLRESSEKTCSATWPSA